ncbi:hypothetical protein A9Q99_04795 [Gammaproteobacteria bacterium 45_16_T64]|nr:hypothetical protein A9Q99_04795 [Gammaproteobacteria bacterium 45_16_T64]
MFNYNFTIATKIKLALVLFAALTLTAILYLNISIRQNSEISASQKNLVDGQLGYVDTQSTFLSEQKISLGQLELSNKLAASFSSVRFWLYDLSVSWLNESEENFESAKEETEALLVELEKLDSDAAKEISGNLEIFCEKMLEAVDAYVDGNRVLGNSFVAQSRTVGLEIDNRLAGLLAVSQKSVSNTNEKVDSAALLLSTSATDIDLSVDVVVSNNDRLETAAIVSLIVIVILSLGFGFVLINTIIPPIDRIKNTLLLIESNSDLTISTSAESNDELGVTGRALNGMVAKFKHTIENLADMSLQLHSAADHTAEVMNKSSEEVFAQQDSTDQVAAAINEMSHTVQEVAENTVYATDSANIANEAAKDGHDVVVETIQVMNDLSTKVDEACDVISTVSKESTSIGGVLEVIRGISEQTNLLALNAAIEAARAGDSGRGFAVVADEVRTLAQRTHESTAEIQSVIERLQKGASIAVTVMEEGKVTAKKAVEQSESAGEALEAITTAVSKITEVNFQIASAAEEQSAATDEINRRVHHINETATTTSEAIRATASACKEQQELSRKLEGLVNQFKIK